MTTLTLDTPALARQYEELSDKQYEHGKLLIQVLGLGPGWRVLDIGCGTGRLTEYVASPVDKAGHVVGIDPLQTRIAIARARAATNLSFQVGHAERLDGFFDNSFDVVYLSVTRARAGILVRT